MCLHARYHEAGRATWPALRLATQSTAAQGVSSPRRLSTLVSQFIETGYLELRASPRDRRVRILTPTAKMVAQDQDWLVSHYLPLQVLFPKPGYAPIMQRDGAFQLVHRLITSRFFALSGEELATAPLVMP